MLMLETIRNISAVLGCASIALGLICTINKTARDWISKIFARKKCEETQKETMDSLCAKLDAYINSNEEFKNALLEDMEVQKDFSRDQCRNNIKDIFYRYCGAKKIPLYEFKAATDTYSTYKDKLHGNHYIALLYNEMQKWEIDYTHSFEEDE